MQHPTKVHDIRPKILSKNLLEAKTVMSNLARHWLMPMVESNEKSFKHAIVYLKILYTSNLNVSRMYVV